MKSGTVCSGGDPQQTTSQPMPLSVSRCFVTCESFKSTSNHPVPAESTTTDLPVEARSTSSCVVSSTSRARLIASRRLPCAADELVSFERAPTLPPPPEREPPERGMPPATSVPPGSDEVVGSRLLREGANARKARFSVGSIGSQSVRISFSEIIL